MTLMISVSGVRGLVGSTLDVQTAADFAAAFGTELGPHTVVVARDSRPSGGSLCEAVCQALAGCGCSVVNLGIVSTPAAALMVGRLRAAGGVIITASHNPAPWNGLKFLNAEGLAPPLEQARRIWARRERRDFAGGGAVRAGSVRSDTSAAAAHVGAVLAHADVPAIRRQAFHVVLDSVCGAGGVEGRSLLEALGCRVLHLGAEPSGDFPHPPEPLRENLEGLCAAVAEAGADVGFAQDPDADRLAVVDETGRFIGEEYTLALAALEVFSTRPGPAAANLSTSRMIDELAARCGPPCAVHRTPVGEAHVAQSMKRHRCVIGGEGNGGVIDPRVVSVRNSIAAMSLILQLLARRGRPLSALVAELPPQHMIKEKAACASAGAGRVLQSLAGRFPGVPHNEADGLRLDWPEGWVHVRTSNTEPILRLIAEAADEETARDLLGRVKQACADLLPR
jgi:phosphomannomutase